MATTKQFDCPGCSAQLEYDPNVQAQTCPYCGYVGQVEIAAEAQAEAVAELDFHEYLSKAAAAEDTVEQVTVSCMACSAQTTLEPNVTSTECPFCGTKIVTQGESKRVIKPRALLPFSIPKEQAAKLWQEWIASLWFAPSKLKSDAKDAEGLNGIYLPYWTYDADTRSYFTGQKGRHKWKKQGGQKVMTVRWKYVEGQVDKSFDDVLVIGSGSVPEKHATRLPPWDLDNLVPYDDGYLSGFRAEAYQTDLEAGFGKAKEQMDTKIRKKVNQRIGGDVQTITSLQTSIENVTFKHILLPLWISAYRFNDKVFQYLVNGRTGKVRGDRPYSWVKITLTVLAALIVIAAIVLLLIKFRVIKLRFR
jgi:DNA-directed RNA polymerase subunit RPC12/RpoP